MITEETKGDKRQTSYEASKIKVSKGISTIEQTLTTYYMSYYFYFMSAYRYYFRKSIRFKNYTILTKETILIKKA